MKNDKARHFKHLLNHHKEDHEEVIDDMEGVTMGEYNPFYLDELSSYDNHPAEIASELFDVEHYMALKKLQLDELKQIREASAKVEEGTFGICEACGKEIDGRRLELLPQARFCIDCARRAEEETLDIKETTMNKRPPEEQELDPTRLSHYGTVENQSLEDVMHYGSASNLD